MALLPREAGFACAAAAALADWQADLVDDLCREMTCSNDLRKQIVWLIEALPQARQPEALSLAQLKRLIAPGYFEDLKQLLRADLAARHEELRAWQVLTARSEAIRPEDVQPAPLVSGEDLKALNVTPGPIYKTVLDAVYTAQLNEQLPGREQALALLKEELARAQGHAS